MAKIVLRSAAAIFVLAFLSLSSFSQQATPQSLKEQYVTVLKLLTEKDYDNAIIASKAIIERVPGYDHAYQKLVEASKKKSTLVETKEYFQKSSSFNPAANYGLGLEQQQLGEHSLAVESLQKCLAQLPAFAPGFRALVDSYLVLKQGSDAENYLRQFSTLSPNNSTIYYGLGYLYYRERKFENALAALETAIGLNPKLADAHLAKAQIYNSLAQYQQSLDACRDALSCIDEQDTECYGTTLVFIGAMRWKLASYDQAASDLNRALDYVRATGNKLLEVSALGHLGATYWYQDDYVKALIHWQSSLQTARQFETGLAEGRHLGNIGLAHQAIGNLDESLVYFREALALAEQSKDISSEVTNRLNIGEVYVAEKKYKEAETYFDQALVKARQARHTVLEIFTLLDLAHVYSETDRLTASLQALESALQLANGAGNLRVMGEVFNASGNLKFKRADAQSELHVQEAINDFQSALRIGEAARMPKIIWQAHTGLAAAFEKLGQFEEADSHYRQAIESVEDIRSKLEGEEDRSGFLEDKIKVYHDRIGLLLKRHQASSGGQYEKEAFDTLERARSRSFLDLLAGSNATIEQEISPQLRSQKQEISHQLSTAQTQLLRELAKRTSDRKEIQKLEREIAERKEAFRVWRQQLRLRHPQIADLLTPIPIKLQQAQQMLGEDQALLEYSLGGNQSFLFVVTKQKYLTAKIAPGSIINVKVEQLLKMLREASTQDFEAFCQTATELYQILIQPAIPLLTGKKEVIVAGDGILYHLPFEVLVRPANPVGSVSDAQADSRELPYLITDFTITYVPSASVLAGLIARQMKPSSATEQFLAFADPDYGHSDKQAKPPQTYRSLLGGEAPEQLQKSRYEVRAIASFFAPKTVKLFLGKEASETNAKDSDILGRYRILHFSVHGRLEDQRPQLSGLILSLPQTNQAKRTSPKLNGSKGVLSKFTQEDGVLRVNEVFKLKLNADLVTLSACETGLGKVMSGEGMIGLTRAFLYAGTPSVVVSLWKVEETATAKLMIRFYENLKSGKYNKAESLRRAQLESIGKGNHPASWASFILVGKS